MNLEVGIVVIWARKIPMGTLRVRCRVMRLLAAAAIVCPDIENWQTVPKSRYRVALREELLPVETLTEKAV